MTITESGIIAVSDVNVEIGQPANFSSNLRFLNDLIKPNQRPEPPAMDNFYGKTYYTQVVGLNCDNGNCNCRGNCGNIQCTNCYNIQCVNCSQSDSQNWLQANCNCACTYNCTAGEVSYNCNCACNCSKIICGKLHEYGLMSTNVWAADQAYGRQLRKTEKHVYRGYIRWARTVTAWMEGKGPDFMYWVNKDKRHAAQQDVMMDITYKIGSPWSQHMAYLMGAVPEDNAQGRILMKIGRFFCKAVNYVPKLPTRLKRHPLVKPYSIVTTYAILGAIYFSYYASVVVMKLKGEPFNQAKPQRA